ncbi:hypothetical protein COS91_06105 [Candidatus Desantisbacteria bacterium CG07_land_8_20_14_0_80_39_15]|uniref:Uncharacterized protein n=2 Tax=unclassified Candidatus Desantisiibacteriota TaxID=3106372 RepID=A0A2H9PAD2_9BACT|nr:MAG: hypothetical protein COS91_06105 [Candidatus Desantisbacteria bacterium CG07_land_8_20_14_0_80_39_15]PIZ15380.1 MAG: hypothetical protein COY51_05385 [Candidatus Desantisbacteria bacterium CG_4_10_14_0_8_um_filter_39_17]
MGRIRNIVVLFARTLSIERYVPLAPNPKSAMLIDINAKWYHSDIANMRSSVDSRISVATEIRKISK